jgi:hypothetical protein
MVAPRLQARRRLCRPHHKTALQLPRVGVASDHGSMLDPPSMLPPYDDDAFVELLSVSITLHLRTLIAATAHALFP